LDYVLERKSLTDLLSSIKDSNRYTSQKYFLNRSGLKNKYYLVEGDVETLPNPRDVKTIKTASSSTEIIDGFRVLRTKGVQETFRLYQSMTEGVVQLYSNLTSNSSNSRSSSMATNTPLSFDAFKEHMRQQNQGSTTVHDIWGRMLIEVPGLGPEAASVILHNYPVPKLLYEDYRKALVEGIASGRGGTVVAQGLLAGLRGENGGRSIGPDKAKKVYQALFMNRWNLQ
jgi:ERCC4-type nuclease